MLKRWWDDAVRPRIRLYLLLRRGPRALVAALVVLIVVVADGRVVQSGSHAELMAAGGLYAELYGVQAESYR